MRPVHSCAAWCASIALALAGLGASAGQANDTGAGASEPAEPAVRKAKQSTAPPAQKPAASEQTKPAASTPKVTLRVPAGNARGPDVTVIAGEQRTVYEYRQNGQLRMIKVVPKLGRPYYLTPRDPTRGFGDLEQADSLIAEWVLREF